MRLKIATLEESGAKAIPLDFDAGNLVGGRRAGGTLVRIGVPRETDYGAFWLGDSLLSLNRRGGFAVSGGQLISRSPAVGGEPLLVFRGNPVAGELAQHAGKIILKKPSAQTEIDSGVYVGSLAPHNWFHWLIDTLPVIYSLRHLPDKYDAFPVLLPAESVERETWRTALEIALAGRSFRLVRASDYSRVKSLIMMDGVSSAFPRPNSLSGRDCRIFIREQLAHEFRDRILSELGLSTKMKAPWRRTYIGRKNSAVRKYNQDEIYSIAGEFGFERIYLEDLSFADSVKVFTEAACVIGPHGAGFANMLFTRPGTKVLLLSWNDTKGDNWYETLFAVSAADATFLEYPTGGFSNAPQDPRNADYILRPEAFRASLQKMVG